MSDDPTPPADEAPPPWPGARSTSDAERRTAATYGMWVGELSDADLLAVVRGQTPVPPLKMAVAIYELARRFEALAEPPE